MLSQILLLAEESLTRLPNNVDLPLQCNELEFERTLGHGWTRGKELFSGSPDSSPG